MLASVLPARMVSTEIFRVSGAGNDFLALVDPQEAPSPPLIRAWCRRGISLGGCDGTDEMCPERRNPALTLREAATLRRLPSVQAVTVWWDESRPFRYRDRYLQNVGYDAFSAEWLETDAGDIAPGRNFSALEEQAAARVVIINDSLQAQLFADGDPIGKQIQIASQPFTDPQNLIGATAESDLRQRGGGHDRPLPGFATAGSNLAVWCLVLALLLLAARSWLR